MFSLVLLSSRVVAVVKSKAGVVLRLSEMVKVQFMVASYGSVRSQVCCGRVWQCTATSANLCLAFRTERFLSRKSWAGRRGCWQGHSDADSVFVLRRPTRVVSGIVSAVGRSSPLRGEKVRGDGDEWYGLVLAHGRGGGNMHREARMG